MRLLIVFATICSCLGVSAQTDSLSLHSESSAVNARLSYDAFFLEAMVQRQKGNNDAAFDLLQHCV